MSSIRPCVDRHRLQDHLHEQLSEDDEARVIAHLDTCEACQATLEELAADRQLLRVAQDAGHTWPTHDTTLEHLLIDLEGRDDEAQSVAMHLVCLEPPTKPGTIGRLAHYHVLEIAGRGGMGVALKAIDEKLGRLTCLKVFVWPSAASHSVRERLQREARAAAAVESERVVKIYAVDEHRGWPYLAMEFVSGRSLQEEIDHRGALPIDKLLQIGADVARGLAAAHAKGLVHRDIKPGNILLENGSNRAKLTDFGMARALDDGRLTVEGCIAGTPEYMSPEQVRGEAVDHRADLFSLGSVLYTMCTGRSPFAAESSLAVLRRILDDTPRPVEQLRPDVPPALARLIARLHAKNPAARPQSAEEVLDLLARCEPSSVVRFRASRRAAMLAVGTALIGGASVAALLSRRIAHQKKHNSEAASAGQTPLIDMDRPHGNRQLLIVLAPGFDAPDYFGVYGQLRARQVNCRVASTTLEAIRPRQSHVTTAVRADLLIGDADARDYDAIFFGGGEGCEVYAGAGSHAVEARKLIKDALAAGRIVAAMGIGPVILAEAGVLRGRPATCSPYGAPASVYVDRLETAGARWQDVPVVEDDPFITGREPRDVNEFIQALGRRLGARPKTRSVRE